MKLHPPSLRRPTTQRPGPRRMRRHWPALALALLAATLVWAGAAAASCNFLLSWGTEGLGPGQFENPRGIAVDGAGNVYVAESGNTRVQKFDSNGNSPSQFGV